MQCWPERSRVIQTSLGYLHVVKLAIKDVLKGPIFGHIDEMFFDFTTEGVSLNLKRWDKACLSQRFQARMQGGFWGFERTPPLN